MEKTGIKLTREVSLEVDWVSLAENLLKLVTEGFKAFYGDFKGGVNAALALIGAAKAIKEDVSPGAKGLELIILCFAWSFDTLRATGHLSEDTAKNAARDAIDKLKKQVETGDLEIPFDFFEQPSSARPYQLLRNEFIIKRSAFRPPGADENEAVLKARFDSAFRSSVWDIWADRAAVFDDLAQALSSQAAKTSDFEKQWRAYRESIVSDFHVAPVFGQEETRVSLGQLFVPLRCLWREAKNANGETSRYASERTEAAQIHHIRMIQNELNEWIDNGDENDWLRLVGGGPGSGKSTSAKAFAARLAEQRPDLRPLFIPLQHIKGPGRFRDCINNYFRDRTGSPFRVGPIERSNVENGPRLVLIFDGLDEIARPGISADDIARDTIDWITDLYRELTGETAEQHRVLVTGRMPSFQAARRRANRKGREALEVLNYLPVNDQNRRSLELRAISSETIEGDKAVIRADDRELWWKRFSSALGRPVERPAGLRDARLMDLTSEPLLCYLLALSGYLEQDTEKAATNRNNIYDRLLCDVWRRGWGGGRVGTGKSLNKKDFDRLFETMALAAWHGGDERIATYERFVEALKVTDADRIYEDFRKQEGEDVSNLAVNFYLKRPEVEARGFEFTHKSFGEYLAARALITAARDCAEFSQRRMEVALEDWLSAVADGKLTFELLEFLKDESRLLPFDIALENLRSLERMMSEVLANGFPAHRLHLNSWREIEERQRKSEIILMTLLHCMSSRVLIENEEEARIQIDWKDDDLGFGNLIHRLRRTRNSPVPELSILSYIDAPDSNLIGQDLIEANLQGVDLERGWCFGASFIMADLSFANLNRAGLRGTNFTRASCYSADFSYCDFQESNLSEGEFASAKFLHANLMDAVLKESILTSVDFRSANLEGANLEKASLEGANFENANLEGANLHGANLNGANLKGASLLGAYLTDANLKGANIEGANFHHAVGLGEEFE